MTGLFISWTRQNGRTQDLARELDLEARFVFSSGRFGLLGRYVRQLRATRQLLAETRPEVAVFMLPPAPILLALLPRRSHAPGSIAFDLHTGFFGNPKWRWLLRPSLRLIRRIGGTAIVTNTHLQSVCHDFGIPAIVLHDVVKPKDRISQPGSYLLCPLSYANDEPVSEIIAAARATPDLEWRLTGRAPKAVQAASPPNVTFTGFIDDMHYAALIAGSLGVVALTTRPHTMQRAGYEAFSAGVPQITSNFPELRDFYGDSAVYAEPYAADITEAVHRLKARQHQLTSRIVDVRHMRVSEQQLGLTRLKRSLNIGEPEYDQTSNPVDGESRA